MADPSYTLDNISVSAKNEGRDSYFDLEAPFADIHVKGQYDYATLYQSCKNLVASKLPTLPGIGKISNQARNNFAINLEVRSTEILRRMLGIPLDINSPIYADGMISDKEKQPTSMQISQDSYITERHSATAWLMFTLRATR